MKADRAAALHITSLSDLTLQASGMTLGSDLEFLSRPEWRALQAAYGLHFRAMRRYQPTFMYRALQGGEVDVISAFSSDGRMAADHLLALSDPKGAAPSYDAVILLAPSRAADAPAQGGAAAPGRRDRRQGHAGRQLVCRSRHRQAVAGPGRP